MIHFISGQSQVPVQGSVFKTSSMDRVLSYCQSRSVLGLDTETEGKFDHSNQMIMLQIGDEYEQFVIDVRSVDISPLKPILENTEIVKILWNAKFDLKFFRMKGLDVMNVYDGFLAEKALYNGIRSRSLSLETAAHNYLGKELDKETRGSFPKGSKPFTDRQIRYGAEDVEFLPQIRRMQLEELKKWEILNEAELENRYIRVHADMEYFGIKIDTERWERLEEDKYQQLQEARRQLDDYVSINGHEDFVDHQGDLFSNRVKSTINWSSPKQVAEFCQHIGLETRVKDPKTGKIKHSVDESQIRKNQDKFPQFVELFLDYKAKSELVSRYGKKFLLHMNKRTGRIHSDFFPFINTGRLSSSEPNMQNIPNEDADPEYRRCFIPKKGMKYVVADYSQQEPRVTADKSGDDKLINFFKEGDGDTHSLVASIISPMVYGEHVDVKKEIKDDDGNVIQEGNDPYVKDLGKSLRAVGKTTNLGLDYGKSAYTLKDDLKCSQEYAQKIMDKISEELPGKQKYFQRKIDEAFKKGYILIDDLTGRKFFIENLDRLKELEHRMDDPFWDKYRKERRKGSDQFINELYPIVKEYFTTKGNIERDAQNYSIQGTGASMIKYAVVTMADEFLRRGWYPDRARIIMILHDEIVVECDEDISQEVSELTKEHMESAGRVFCKKVPQVVSPVIVDHWTHD